MHSMRRAKPTAPSMRAMRAIEEQDSALRMCANTVANCVHVCVCVFVVPLQGQRLDATAYVVGRVVADEKDE